MTAVSVRLQAGQVHEQLLADDRRIMDVAGLAVPGVVSPLQRHRRWVARPLRGRLTAVVDLPGSHVVARRCCCVRAVHLRTSSLQQLIGNWRIECSGLQDLARTCRADVLLSSGSRVGAGRDLGASLHQLIERESISNHDLVRQHVRVVGRERLARRSLGHDL